MFKVYTQDYVREVNMDIFIEMSVRAKEPEEFYTETFGEWAQTVLGKSRSNINCRETYIALVQYISLFFGN